MNEKFREMLTVGGESNSLGRTTEVIELVLSDQSRLDELYGCIFNEGAWVRMRAVDAFEKVCREHPDWILSYIDRFADDLLTSAQPSIQWHLAQIYRQVELTDEQKKIAISWLMDRLSTTDVDWIVSANTMDTLVYFTKDGSFPKAELTTLIKIQQLHKSKSVVKRADRLLTELST